MIVRSRLASHMFHKPQNCLWLDVWRNASSNTPESRMRLPKGIIHRRIIMLEPIHRSTHIFHPVDSFYAAKTLHPLMAEIMSYHFIVV